MKRKLSLTDILSNLTLNEDNKKSKYCIIKNTHIKHEDIFNIGKINFEKDFYSRDELIMILNAREATLYEKFIKTIKQIVCHSSINNIITIPHWIQ